jgi:superfamily II DNA or RNA helicase
LVVIDESHHAITPSYTRLLDSFLPEEPTEGTEDMPPFIGLTATPFRGKSEEETRWLANRFARRMLPSVERQSGLYEELRDEGILSQIDSEVLHHDTPFSFTESELEHLGRFKEMPESALQRLASDDDRNELIVDRLKEASQDGPVLLFANSVEHAQHQYWPTLADMTAIQLSMCLAHPKAADYQAVLRSL